MLDDTDMDEVKPLLFSARLYNAGQVCVSSKRFIVTEKNYDRFIADLKDEFAKAKWGDSMDPSTTLAPLSSATAKKDVLQAINNSLYNKEIFGPVGEVYKVKDEAEAIALANDSSYGLGNTIFSSNLEHAREVGEKIETGMSCINAGFTRPKKRLLATKNKKSKRYVIKKIPPTLRRRDFSLQ